MPEPRRIRDARREGEEYVAVREVAMRGPGRRASRLTPRQGTVPEPNVAGSRMAEIHTWHRECVRRCGEKDGPGSSGAERTREETDHEEQDAAHRSGSGSAEEQDGERAWWCPQRYQRPHRGHPAEGGQRQ